jgi:hypothetical protein
MECLILERPNTSPYLPGFSRSAELCDQQIAVQSDISKSWHTLTRREWVVLQHALVATDVAVVASRSTVALQQRLGVRERMAQCDSWPAWYVGTVLMFNRGYRAHRADLLPITQREVLRLRDRFLELQLLVPAPVGLAASHPVTLPRVCITTANRPTALERCLTHLAEDAARTGEPIVVTVHDNSSTEADELRNQQLCLNLDCGPIRIVHCGESWRRSLRKHLVASGIARSVVEFALWGFEHPRTGANRNAVLLSAAGARIVMLDDDIIPHVWTRGDRGTVTLSRETDPRDVRFGRTRAELMSGLVRRSDPIWRSHAALLGSTVESALQRHCLAPASGGFVASIGCWGDLVRNGRIRATLHGVVDDSGMGWLRRWLLLDGCSRTALVKSRRIYDESCANGLASRTTGGVQLSSSGNGAVGGFGMDAGGLLPPFLPSYRCSDALFLILLKYIHSNNVVAFLPETVEHWPLEDRVNTRGPIWVNTGLRFWEIIRLLVSRQGFELPDGSPTQRLEAVGRAISEVASAPAKEFREFLRDIWRQHVSDWLIATERAMERHGEQPAWWADDVRRLRDKLIVELAQDDAELPRDLEKDPRNGSANIQRVLGYAGELYQAWPAIWQSAQSITLPWDSFQRTNRESYS